MTIVEIFDLISRGGAIATLTLGLWLFFNEGIVSGRAHRRVLRERDELQRELFETLGVADRATQIAAREVGRRRRASYGESQRLEAEHDLQRQGWADLPDAK